MDAKREDVSHLGRPCPVCGVGAGDPCRHTLTGARLPFLHAERTAFTPREPAPAPSSPSKPIAGGRP